ncbi:hypothetical protein CCHR01_04671 [Colletotrichum chrysophilum]|uniref:Uncharacterized protein n=1 Tax=Colletotrichum chrysophilum TaxID=1836956 RepID=A0AAD9ASL2_9PEZI|nr:hypothetical protein CCHR01_04671 [Colletotrichum chrysophilum]
MAAAQGVCAPLLPNSGRVSVRPLALFVLLLPFAVLRASVRLLPPPDRTTPMTRTGGIDRRATWEVLHACRFRADVACEDRGAVDLDHHPDAIDGGRFTALLFFCRRPSRESQFDDNGRRNTNAESSPPASERNPVRRDDCV